MYLYNVLASVAKKHMYIENRIWGKSVGTIPVGAEADGHLLGAATPRSSSVFHWERESKGEGNIGCRRRAGGKE